MVIHGRKMSTVTQAVGSFRNQNALDVPDYGLTDLASGRIAAIGRVLL